MDKHLSYAYFPGCKLSVEMPQDGIVFEIVMKHLGVDLVSLPFHCCGYPARSEHFEASIFSTIKNIAIAEKKDLDILTPCKCCFGQFKHAMYWYAVSPELKERIDLRLAEEALEFKGRTEIFHMLNFLHEQVGLEEIKKHISQSLLDEKMVVQYGCHALRPHAVTQFDQPGSTGIFEDLLSATGVQILEWSGSRICCANPIQETAPKLSSKILQQKFDSAAQLGAQSVCMACTHCRIQYHQVSFAQEIISHGVKAEWFPTVMARAMGLSLKD